jgi:hypothetical protein
MDNWNWQIIEFVGASMLLDYMLCRQLLWRISIDLPKRPPHDNGSGGNYWAA